MIDRIKHIQGILESDLPRGEFAIVHSAWLTLMGLRLNGDLDLIISSALRQERFADIDPSVHFGLPGLLERRIRIQPRDSAYGGLHGVKDLDDVIYNYCVEIDGLRFVEPRFYFAIKNERLKINRRRWQALSGWRRATWFFDYGDKKLRSKRRKDEKDFMQIETFFIQGGHRRAAFDHMPIGAWGEPGRDWMAGADV